MFAHWIVPHQLVRMLVTVVSANIATVTAMKRDTVNLSVARRSCARRLVTAMVLLLAWPQLAGGQSGQPSGLTEPYRAIEVAAAESGVVVELCVREGQAVQRGQVLAVLDCDVLAAMLAVAQQGMQAKGGRNSALADVQLRADRLRSFEAVFAKGHARQEEVDRARAELAMAEARLLAVEEELGKQALECERIKVQIERRTIRAPIDGVVSKIEREVGEFLPPTAPLLLTLVQLNPLLAVFSLPSAQARQLRAEQEVLIRWLDSRETVRGKIDLVAPTTDPESGTVLVKVRIDNTQRRFRSGERCEWHLAGDDLPAALPPPGGASASSTTDLPHGDLPHGATSY